MHCFMVQEAVPRIEVDKLQGHLLIEEVRVGQSKENSDCVSDYQQILVTDIVTLFGPALH